MLKRAIVEYSWDFEWFPVGLIILALLLVAVVGNSLELVRACEMQTEVGPFVPDQQKDEITASCIRPPGAE
jgi:hypothetical protein